MTCFAARQIGASDFCTAALRRRPDVAARQDAVCVQGNALLKACNPDDDNDKAAHPNGACDHAELGCLRTDVLPNAEEDEGVCITMRTLPTRTSTATIPVRSVCAATFLQASSTRRTTAFTPTTSIACRRAARPTRRRARPARPACARSSPPAADPPDICVPNCDSQPALPAQPLLPARRSRARQPGGLHPGPARLRLRHRRRLHARHVPGRRRHRHRPRADHSEPVHHQLQQRRRLQRVRQPAGAVRLQHRTSNICATPNAYRGAICDDRRRLHPRRGFDVHALRADRRAGDLPARRATPTALACRAAGSTRPACRWSRADGPLPICLPGLFGYPAPPTANCVGDLAHRPAAASRPTDRRRCSAPPSAPPTTTAPTIRWTDRRLVRQPLDARRSVFRRMAPASPCSSRQHVQLRRLRHRQLSECTRRTDEDPIPHGSRVLGPLAVPCACWRSPPSPALALPARRRAGRPRSWRCWCWGPSRRTPSWPTT